MSIGGVQVGGGAPVSVQSMTKTDTRDSQATSRQIRQLAEAGCEIVRVAVPDMEAARALRAIVAASPVPVVADIHFDARLAVAAAEQGVHCIRINPGNIGPAPRLRLVADAAEARRIPIRVGVNAGSIEKELVEAHGGRTAEALAESALRQCERLEALGFDRIKVSLKSSDVLTTVRAYRLFGQQTEYPLHVGVTEAGTPGMGVVKSAVAIGALLLDGIGDTIRVSLTAPPVREVEEGIRILRAVGLRRTGPEIVSCPTCGRTQIEILKLVNAVEDEVERLAAAGKHLPIRKIAVMGCVVNGPGEAADADLGVAGGKGKGVLFSRGEVVGSYPEDELLEALVREIRRAAVPVTAPARASE